MATRHRIVIVAGLLAALLVVPSFAQFTDEELANRPNLESILESAEIVDSKQMPKSEGVTQPYKLTLGSSGQQYHALWKNPSGRTGGFIEGWKYEIAAYELDKYLGLGMVPPTAERRFKNNLGSIQIWVEHWMSGREKLADKIPVPGANLENWNRRTYLQRAFDNLIANEDRHLGNILITEDWRMLLIDHSRSFRTSKKFTKKLQFAEDKPMKKLPRGFVEKIRELDEATLRGVVGKTLTDQEIEAVLARRVLILEEVERIIGESSENLVLYN